MFLICLFTLVDPALLPGPTPRSGFIWASLSGTSSQLPPPSGLRFCLVWICGEEGSFRPLTSPGRGPMPWGPPREAPPAERGLRIPGAGDCRVAARRGRGQVWGGAGAGSVPYL